MRESNLIKDCKQLVSRIPKNKVDEIKSKIISKEITSKTSKLKLSSEIDLDSQEIEILNKIIKNSTTIENLPIIFDLVLELNSDKKSSTKTSLVWSGPIVLHDYADNTSITMIKMINSAKISITLLSYIMMENTRKIFDALIHAAKRGVSIKLAFNNGEKEKKKILKMWDENTIFPEIFTFNPKKRGTSLHAKVLIIDSKEILTTSANVTSHGINSNFELGIHHKGSVAKDAEKLIELLEKNKHLVKVSV